MARHETGQNVALKEIEASLGQSSDDDGTLIAVMGIRRDFRLTEDPNANVVDHAEFLDRLNQLRYQRRLTYQDDAAPAVPLETPAKRAKSTSKRPAKKASSPAADGTTTSN